MITLAYEVWQQKRREKNVAVADANADVGVIPTDDKKSQIVVIGSKQFMIGGKSGLGLDLDRDLTMVAGIK